MKIIMVSLLLSFLSQQVIAQAESFDIATYTAPAGFTKTNRQGVVNYTSIDTAAGKFCVISIYASGVSSGDPDKDFKKEWKELVVTPYKAVANPDTETQTTPDGWKVVTGAAAIKESGIDCYLILTVLSGFGKTMTIRSSLNDQSYTGEIDALFTTMELDKTKKTVLKNDTAPVQASITNNGKFGQLSYMAPAGWTEQVFADGVVFKPISIPANEHLAIQIMTPLKFNGTLEQALRQSYDEAAAMYKGTEMYFAGAGNYKTTEAHKSFRGWEYIRGQGGIQVDNGTAYKTEMGLELFVIKVNDRFERVAILESRTYCNSSRHFASDRDGYRNAIEQLLFSLQFSDFTIPALNPGSAKGTGITGVWQGVIQSTTATRVQLDVYSLIFFDNGQVFFGTHFPTEGLDGLNSRLPPERSRRDWKTYTYNGKEGNLKMIYADIPFRMENNKLILTKNKMDWPYFKMKPVDGARFSGTYHLREDNGKIPAITFSADGRFVDHGALKVLFHEYIDCLNPAATPGEGSYEVKDYTATFTYTDGRKISIAFIGTDYEKANPSPPVLRMSFDDNPMTRQ